MTTLLDRNVGKVWVPELDQVTFGPAFPTGQKSHYVGIVSYTARPGPVLDEHGRLVHVLAKPGLIQKGWGLALSPIIGLAEKWREDEQIRRFYRTAEEFIAAVRRGCVNPFAMGWAHNERVTNGARMVAKGFWGASSGPTQASVGVPSWIALNKTSSFTTGNFTFGNNGADVSLGSGGSGPNNTSGSTANEFTNGVGLNRTNGTVSGYTDPLSALDGQFQLTVANTFTCTSGPQTVYGAALVDAVSLINFNLYAEAPFASATLQTNDTLAVTWTVKD